MSEQQIDFGFLRECVAALRNAAPEAPFHMRNWMVEWPMERNGWCGTPMCVLGHWANQKAMNVPAGQSRFERLSEMIDAATGTGALGTDLTVHGLNEAQVEQLFGGGGCNGALTKTGAIRYIESFIVKNGGSLEEPKPLDVTIAPDWDKLVQQPAAEEVVA